MKDGTVERFPEDDIAIVDDAAPMMGGRPGISGVLSRMLPGVPDEDLQSTEEDDKFGDKSIKLIMRLQCGWSRCRTGNGKKLISSQVCCLAQLCLAAA